MIEPVKLVPSTIPAIPAEAAANSNALPPEFTCSTCPAEPKLGKAAEPPLIAYISVKLSLHISNASLKGVPVPSLAEEPIFIDCLAIFLF